MLCESVAGVCWLFKYVACARYKAAKIHLGLKGSFMRFLNPLYGGVDEPEFKIIDVFVCKLRKKLSSATGGEHYIETVWGRGYTFVGEQI